MDIADQAEEEGTEHQLALAMGGIAAIKYGVEDAYQAEVWEMAEEAMVEDVLKDYRKL
jgi:hypothetical protein